MLPVVHSIGLNEQELFSVYSGNFSTREGEKKGGGEGTAKRREETAKRREGTARRREGRERTAKRREGTARRREGREGAVMFLLLL